MTEALKLVRDLPGVAELEARLHAHYADKNSAWSPERDALAADSADLSRRLFGLADDDTEFDDAWVEEGGRFAGEDWATAYDRWEEHFALLRLGNEAGARIVFEAMGWDVTDGRGEDLLSLDLIGRPLVCAAKGLLGRLPGSEITDQEAEDRAKAWGDRLAKAAQDFKSRGKRP